MKILFGITGSIAAYKAYDTVRELVKAGHEVKVILSKGALEFIKPKTFTYLGAINVFGPKDDFEPQTHNSAILHIDLRNWCDKIIIYPLSANTMAKIAYGMADDLLLSTLLANTSPVLLFPAMNSSMYANPITQKNISFLKSLKNFFIHPTVKGVLACGEEGDGKVCLPEEAFNLIETWIPEKIESKNVLITTGATIAPIDPVRFMTNPASGKTGYLLAKKYLSQGHKVKVVAGDNSAKLFQPLLNHPLFSCLAIKTTNEMKDVVLAHFEKCDIYISAAAICDMEFNYQKDKIKKNKLEGKLEYNKSADILAEVLKHKKENQKVIGFAAETDLSTEVLVEKLKAKPVDLLVGNIIDNGILSQTKKGFAADEGEYIFSMNGELGARQMLSKAQLAQEIFNWSTTH